MHVPRNQSFFSFCSSSLCIFSNHDLQLVDNYVLKMVIKFVFCVVSLLWTSRYVLIDISNLTHFLCRNLFVMSCLTQLVNSNFRICFRNSLTIFVNYSLWMVNAITNTLKPLVTAISENVLEIRVSYLAGPLFVSIFTYLTHFYGLPYGVWWLF